MVKKKGSVDPINLIAGIVMISGGVLVTLNYVNLGLLITVIGTLFKALEVGLTGGMK